jgi:hypothetical protein
MELGVVRTNSRGGDIVRRGSALMMGTMAVGRTSPTGSRYCRLVVGAKRGEIADWGVSLGGPNDRACAEESGCSIAGAVGSSLVRAGGSFLVGRNGGFVSKAEGAGSEGSFVGVKAGDSLVGDEVGFHPT